MANSTVRQLPERIVFHPHTTLGRSGYTLSKEDRLGERIEFLDALLCLVTNDLNEEEGRGFQNLNNSMQASVLHLAASLASEVHELHEEMVVDSVNAKLSV